MHCKIGRGIACLIYFSYNAIVSILRTAVFNRAYLIRVGLCIFAVCNNGNITGGNTQSLVKLTAGKAFCKGGHRLFNNGRDFLVVLAKGPNRGRAAKVVKTIINRL